MYRNYDFVDNPIDELVEADRRIGELENELGELREKLADSEERLPHWIPVEERLPKRGEFVIVAKESGAVCESRHDGNGEFYMQESRLYPSHWMPLPEPPEVK